MPQPLDADGLLYRDDLVPGYRFGGAVVERAGGELLAAIERLLRMEIRWSADELLLRLDQILLLDLETTGLSRSAGMLPFLTGLRWWDPAGALRGTFRVEQLLLREPALEPRVLELLRERWRCCSPRALGQRPATKCGPALSDMTFITELAGVRTRYFQAASVVR